MWLKELEGIHSRTDFDLKQHQEYSRKKIQYFDNDTDEQGKPYGNYIPYVVETSVGLDRLFPYRYKYFYAEEKVDKGRWYGRQPGGHADSSFFGTGETGHPSLLKKDGLPEIAREIMNECKQHFQCFYEEKDANRENAIGAWTRSELPFV
jgi:glycyl-tRNA synthetase